jgi:hypothetical protein
MMMMMMMMMITTFHTAFAADAHLAEGELLRKEPAVNRGSL